VLTVGHAEDRSADGQGSQRNGWDVIKALVALVVKGVATIISLEG
jgi:hypothetical protein